ncbi:MAG: hypothetical protein APR55_09985 [Methanolinea sp. SDB]|nr:MAG: hypothetical protein APR55_09985 [Methanolinea sp. SDB]
MIPSCTGKTAPADFEIDENCLMYVRRMYRSSRAVASGQTRVPEAADPLPDRIFIQTKAA